MYVESFKQLTVWQRSIQVVKEVYRLTKSLPESERYGLVNQIRRAAISVPANIAEGKKRKTKKDFLQFLRIADGSAAELETQLFLCRDLYSIDISECISLLTEVSKMLRVIIDKLEPSN